VVPDDGQRFLQVVCVGVRNSRERARAFSPGQLAGQSACQLSRVRPVLRCMSRARRMQEERRHLHTPSVCVLLIGTQFSNLYAAVDTPARAA
jgi:hypothetical protein